MPSEARPELWRTEVADSVAVMNIPGTSHRRREFDIDVSLWVSVPMDHPGPWHELVLEINGQQQWRRRIQSNCPGQTDGLDYHCRLALEAGPAMRIRAIAASHGAVVQRLLIEAREDL